MAERTEKPDELVLAPAIRHALKVRQELKQAGASADGDQVLEDAVRKHWPRARDWHYLCDRCDDTGWVVHHCRPKQRCGRTFCDKHDAIGATYEHTYVIRCDCPKGQPARPVVKIPPDPGEATTVKPRRTWKRLIP